jgi:hypothetical protein
MSFVQNIVKSATHRLALGTLGISCLLHGAIFFVIGGWVLIQAVTPKVTPTAVDSPALMQETEPPPELPDETAFATIPEAASPEQTPSAAAQPPTDLLATTAINPSFPLAPAVGLHLSGNSGASAFGQGNSPDKAAAATQKIVIGNILGARVESAKLGVILDVSGSAHEYLPSVINSIFSTFSDAVIVLSMGGGMANQSNKILPYAKAIPAKADQQLRKDGSPVEQWGRSVLAQINWARTRGPKYTQLFDKLKERTEVYYLSGPGDLSSTQYAFTELYKHGVDTIYWFSDFEDPINENIAKKVLRETKERNIKVIAHNFSGKAKVRGMKAAREIAEATGGSVIIKK